jgi:hypothetical protein
MQFIWRQVPDYLFAADIFALRVTHHLTYKLISRQAIYNAANRMVAQRWEADDPEYFGTCYQGYIIRSRTFLLECVTGSSFGSFDHYDRVGNFMHKLFNLNYLLHKIPAPSFDFLKICVYEKQVYVANWNSIIERKCSVRNLEKSCLKALMPERRRFQQQGYQIKIPKFEYCQSCAEGDVRNCLDLLPKMDSGDWDLEDEDQEEEDHYDESCLVFGRLTKRQGRIRRRNKILLRKRLDELHEY